jgi:hypothetical protein
VVDTLLLGGKIAFGLMGLATGFRLRRMARSGEGLGFHALAAACVFVGGIGLAATALGPGLAGTSWALALVMTIGGDMLERLALMGLGVFMWKVFRPHSPWGLLTAIVLGLGLFASMGWEMACQSWLSYDTSLPSAWGTQVAFALPFAWSAAETGAEWSRPSPSSASSSGPSPASASSGSVCWPSQCRSPQTQGKRHWPTRWLCCAPGSTTRSLR